MRIVPFVLLIAAGAPALAQPPVRQVRYADLDLATPGGVAQLDRRIGHAVDLICGVAAPTDLDGRAAVDACRAATLRDVAQSRATLLAGARPRSGTLALIAR